MRSIIISLVIVYILGLQYNGVSAGKHSKVPCYDCQWKMKKVSKNLLASQDPYAYYSNPSYYSAYSSYYPYGQFPNYQFSMQYPVPVQQVQPQQYYTAYDFPQFQSGYPSTTAYGNTYTNYPMNAHRQANP